MVLDKLRWGLESLKSFYGGRTVEDVETENLYHLLDHEMLENDSFHMGFYLDGDLKHSFANREDVPAAVETLEEELPEDIIYDVELRSGDAGGLIIEAETEFDDVYQLETPYEFTDLNSDRDSRPIDEVRIESYTPPVENAHLNYPHGRLNTLDAVEILKGVYK